MVTIKERKVNNKTYYYLEHSFRINGKVRKKQKYLGKVLPKNIELIKKGFIFEIYKKKWFDLFSKIKRNFSLDQKKKPLSLKEKEIETFMVKFTYNTQKIEGSKLTLRETANLLEKSIAPKEKPLRDVKEAEAHKKVFYETLNHKKDLSLNAILSWHKQLFQNTQPDIAGKIRNHQVAISGSRFTPPTPIELSFILEEFFDWYRKNKDKLHPVELAADVHLKFVTIHPFSDGNGRISRLMMNFILNKNKFPMLDISYEKRNSYYNALERSQVKKNEIIFLQWLFRKYLKEYKNYLI